jgi:hypothetical protein
MANLEQIQKRSEAVAPQTPPAMPRDHTVDRWGRWGRGLAGGVLRPGLILGALWSPPLAASLVGVDACSGPLGCLNNSGTVGNHSCNSRYACNGNKGTVGVGACLGDGACLDNAGTVGADAYVGRNACVGNTGIIGTGQCVADDSCPNNKTIIP